MQGSRGLPINQSFHQGECRIAWRHLLLLRTIPIGSASRLIPSSLSKTRGLVFWKGAQSTSTNSKIIRGISWLGIRELHFNQLSYLQHLSLFINHTPMSSILPDVSIFIPSSGTQHQFMVLLICKSRSFWEKEKILQVTFPNLRNKSVPFH